MLLIPFYNAYQISITRPYTSSLRRKERNGVNPDMRENRIDEDGRKLVCYVRTDSMDVFSRAFLPLCHQTEVDQGLDR